MSEPQPPNQMVDTPTEEPARYSKSTQMSRQFLSRHCTWPWRHLTGMPSRYSVQGERLTQTRLPAFNDEPFLLSLSPLVPRWFPPLRMNPPLHPSPLLSPPSSLLTSLPYPNRQRPAQHRVQRRHLDSTLGLSESPTHFIINCIYSSRAIIATPATMAASGSVFSQTLQEITKTKLDELSKRRQSFEAAKAAVLSSVREEKNPVERLEKLSLGVKKCFAINWNQDNLGHHHRVVAPHQRSRGGHGPLTTELKNLDRFLAQARHDPSVSAKMLSRWEASLVGHLDTQSLKYQYASLYGQLVTEWLSGDQSASSAAHGGDADVEMDGGFEDVGTAAKLEARMEWEKVVFEPANVDGGLLRRYLEGLFGFRDRDKEKVWDALEAVRRSVKTFESSMMYNTQFTQETLRWAISGLLASDLLSDEKREVLRDFQKNAVILTEIADVLNMRMAALSSWSWGDEVALEQRRQISGIFNITMHEDLLQAIFLQHIGVKWSVFLKGTFNDFRNADGAWKPMGKPIPRDDRKRLAYYLGPLTRGDCLASRRRKIYRKHYFVAQLLDHVAQVTDSADGEEEAEYETVSHKRARGLGPDTRASAGQPAPMFSQMSQVAAPAPLGAMPRSTHGGKTYRMAPGARMGRALDESEGEYEGDDIDNGNDNNGPKNAMQRKQRLLHLLSTDILLNTSLNDEITAFHSVFDQWNPLLPHETILGVLEFLGVTETWLAFFRTFLTAPLKFMDDDPSIPPRQRRRGTPAAHVLSDCFGETVFFCLDFAVNQSTTGQPLWRIHDDIWFWSPDHNVAVTAWKTVQYFATVTGTSINEKKTGSVRISKDPNVSLPLDSSLPLGDIRWGFLQLSPSTGRFEIDQTMVDKHIKELQTQLRDKNKSIFGYIQAWNTYAATFFSSNFGKPANCYGVEHVDQMLATHERIQKGVFAAPSDASSAGSTPAAASSVVDYLKKMLEQRFQTTDVPDGYFFFPVEMGGLDLKSPFITLLQIRDSVLASPSKLLDDLAKSERDGYARARQRFLNGKIDRERYSLDVGREVFMKFEEYVRYREEVDLELDLQVQDVFQRLMGEPEQQSVALDGARVAAALEQLAGQANLRGITSRWASMEPYWQWVAMMYGPEIVDRFGGLNIVDSGLLPMGMVSIFREKRVTWQDLVNEHLPYDMGRGRGRGLGLMIQAWLGQSRARLFSKYHSGGKERHERKISHSGDLLYHPTQLKKPLCEKV
ncbi:hypothetical protein ACRALDRAFT_2014643 [Sodiomyces alcalophilus JCM 7366]|uniref:uncharacterized protein n=1 Tax=Sodiomyces alcalophilus JCM 7366 TaxID=591952 RepID=UPI0039B625D4